MSTTLLRKACCQPVRIVIADNHEIARAGLRYMLTAAQEFEIVGEAANGQEAVDLCRQLRPDIVLLELGMPELDGLAATQVIKRRWPGTKIIVFTVQENPNHLIDALRAGASGYLLKDASHQELTSAIRQVIGGEISINQTLTTRSLQQLATEAGYGQALFHNPLTPAERAVLQFFARGLTNREIARRMMIRLNTVKAHTKSLITKLGVCRRAQAVVRAIDLGLLDAENGAGRKP